MNISITNYSLTVRENEMIQTLINTPTDFIKDLVIEYTINKGFQEVTVQLTESTTTGRDVRHIATNENQLQALLINLGYEVDPND